MHAARVKGTARGVFATPALLPALSRKREREKPRDTNPRSAIAPAMPKVT
jgi:hypothetical protein